MKVLDTDGRSSYLKTDNLIYLVINELNNQVK